MDDLTTHLKQTARAMGQALVEQIPKPTRMLAENEQVRCSYCGLVHNDVARAANFGRHVNPTYDPICCDGKE